MLCAHAFSRKRENKPSDSRGADTLYWEDVNIGDEPAPTADGPFPDDGMKMPPMGESVSVHDALTKDPAEIFKGPSCMPPMPGAGGTLELGKDEHGIITVSVKRNGPGGFDLDVKLAQDGLDPDKDAKESAKMGFGMPHWTPEEKAILNFRHLDVDLSPDAMGYKPLSVTFGDSSPSGRAKEATQHIIMT